MRKPDSYRALVAAAALTAPAVAIAHTGLGDTHGVLHGFMHPIGGLDHVLAMVAVGVIAAQIGGRALWAVPASFVVAMAIAGAYGMAGLALPDPAIGIALSVVVLGAVVALRVRLPIAIVAAMVAAFAIFHGYSHALEMDAARSGVAFGFGFVLATALLHLSGIALGQALTRLDRGGLVARIGGAAVAVAGAAMFTSSLVA